MVGPGNRYQCQTDPGIAANRSPVGFGQLQVARSLDSFLDRDRIHLVPIIDETEQGAEIDQRDGAVKVVKPTELRSGVVLWKSVMVVVVSFALASQNHKEGFTAKERD